MPNIYSQPRAKPANPLRSIAGVIDSAKSGYLPLFATTLGMRCDEFSKLPPEDLIDMASQSALRSDSLASGLPDLFVPLVEMLWEHQSCDDKYSRLIAHAIACGCFGQRHLWQDLGLSGKEETSELLARRFYRLYIRNVGNLRWKRFIFRELGLRFGISELLPPGCRDCEDYQFCFDQHNDRNIGA